MFYCVLRYRSIFCNIIYYALFNLLACGGNLDCGDVEEDLLAKLQVGKHLAGIL